MITAFRGRDRFGDYLQALQEVEGGTLSPGGAALMLGITRQRINQVIREQEDVRAWAFYEGRFERAGYLEIAVNDLLRYGRRQGLIQTDQDLPYVGREWAKRLTEERQMATL